MHTLCIFYKHSNLFDSPSKSLYDQAKLILVFQHQFLFLTNAFFIAVVLFFLLAVLVHFLIFPFGPKSIFVSFGYLFLVLLQFSFEK